MDTVFSLAKHNRLLDLYTRLIDGEIINKKKEAERYGVNEKSIQRDIDDLKSFFYENSLKTGNKQELIYERSVKGYYLHCENNKRMTNDEVFAVCKILLESRAFTKEELSALLEKIINNCMPPSDIKKVENLIANEKYYYVELRHKRKIIEMMWELSECMREKEKLEIKYMKPDGKTVKRIVKPVGIMFSEFYFYMAAFIEGIDKEKEFENKNDIFPTIYRVDRIISYKKMGEYFTIPYADRFQEGEFRKRVQFMYGGKLKTVRFEYSGASVDAVLDRLPTAAIEKEANGVYTIRAEVFGKGIDMWLRSQGDNVKIKEN